MVQLSYTILYAKGWYQISDNIVEDLKKVLYLDGYCMVINAYQVTSILLHCWEEQMPKYKNMTLVNFYECIHPNQCWKHSYFTEDYPYKKEGETFPKYDVTMAIIHKILSDFKFLSNTEWIIKTPKYSKELRRCPQISVKEIINRFNGKN